MNRQHLIIALISLLPLGPVLAGEADAKAAPAVTTIGGEVGDLLKKWFAEGTAAGNIGDFYDNRDREHSGLNMSQFPQLQKVQYSKEELDKRADWAFFAGLRPMIVFGNSSTSAGAYEGGSNPRRGYSHQQGLEILYRQYSSDNLYIYPEHRDHDPGHNGVNDGYGDLYPTNTPFLLISQGSSGSDQPFMRAVPLTLAAFRPDVKKALAGKGMLMSTIQMILRYTNKHLTDPAKEYLTGKAHPSVFEGSWVQDAAMIKMAHEITPETLPPQVKLKVVEEDKPKDGLDFFEPNATEVLVNTPAVIARIFRGRQYARRIVVSAQDSTDLNNKALKYHWSVLRGDPARITIKPRNDAGSEAEIEVKYHERMPISPGSNMESNRIDIGVFVHNGSYFSAPAFITYFFLDEEGRAYGDDGRILEIGYKTGETTLNVNDWPKMLGLFKGDAPNWPAKFLRAQLKAEDVKALATAADFVSLVEAPRAAEQRRAQFQALLDKANAALKEAESKENAAKLAAKPDAGDAEKTALENATKAKTAATAERNIADDTFKASDKALNDAKAAADAFLHQKREGLSEPIANLIEGVLRRWSKQPDFLVANSAELAAYLQSADGKPRAGAFNNVRQNLAKLGILKITGDSAHELQLVRKGEQPPAERVTRFEQTMLERFNGDLIAQVLFPGLVASNFRQNYVQPEIAEPPDWRDVYHYSADGTPIGWTRYGGAEPVDFNADGMTVVKRDELGRCIQARQMTYQPEPLTPEQFKKRGWPAWRKTLQNPGKQINYYSYSSEKDWRGKIDKTETAE